MSYICSRVHSQILLLHCFCTRITEALSSVPPPHRLETREFYQGITAICPCFEIRVINNNTHFNGHSQDSLVKPVPGWQTILGSTAAEDDDGSGDKAAVKSSPSIIGFYRGKRKPFLWPNEVSKHRTYNK